MQVAKLQIDRFGAWNDLVLGPFTGGLDVLWGQETADRTAIADFIRTVLFGFDGDLRNQYSSESPRTAGGTLTLSGLSVLKCVQRHDDGNRQGRLIVENENGASLGKHRFENLLANVPQNLFQQVFVADFHRRPQVNQLVDAAISNGMNLVGGHGDSTRLGPLRQRLDEQKRLLQELTTGDRALTSLLERRRSLRTEIEALEATARDFSEKDSLKRRQMQSELVEMEQQLEQLQADLHALDAELKLRQQERLRKESELQQERIDQQQRVIDRRKQVEEIDVQLERWRHVLRDVEIRRERLQSETESSVLASDASVDPRIQLRQLEEQIECLQTSVIDLAPESEAEICRCQQLQTQLGPALQSLREGIYRLCNQLSVWEASARRTENSSELGQMRRCEAELRQAIQGLSVRRQQLLTELSAFQQEEYAVSLVHGDFCRCSEHPNGSETISTDIEQLSMLDEELLSVLDAEIYRLVQRRRNIAADMDEVEQELQSLRERLQRLHEQETINPHQSRMDAKRRELELIEHQICDGEKRREVQAAIVELEAEIRALENATRHSDALQEATTWLRRLSDEELQGISITPERTVRVRRRSGSQLLAAELSASQQDQVYLSLCLALSAAFARQGTQMPLVLHDALIRQNATHRELAAKVLCDFTARGHQVLLLLGSEQVASSFRALGVAVWQLPNPRAKLMSIVEATDDLSEINHQLHLIAEEAGKPEPDVKYAAFSAEEFPGELTDRVRQASTPEPEPVIDELQQSEYFLLESSPIQEAPSIDAATAERFRKINVLYVRDLLRINIEDAAGRLRHAGITAGMIERWRAEALLVCRVTHLRPYDARILVACGIESPQELARLEAAELRKRVETFAATSIGQVLLRAGNPYELSRLTTWIDAARRAKWSEDDRRSSERRRSSQEREARRAARRKAHQLRDSGNNGSSNGTGHSAASIAAKDARVLKMGEKQNGLRFYLSTTDMLEDAPSIGPRTAERFAKLGIVTVADFLRADPDTMATRLDHRYIRSDTILQWQQQTVLCCRVPQLRGHDAQILVACGITDTESLAAANPSRLWEKVEPFCESSEGRRIIRSGKAPDFEEVFNWVQWAGQARQLRAA